MLGVLYRTYFLFLRQHADLTRMYSFGRQVTGVGSSIEDWRGVLEQVRDQLNAEVGGAAAGRRRDRELRTLAIGPEGVLDEPTDAGGRPAAGHGADHRAGRVVDRPQPPTRTVLAALAEPQGLGRAGGSAALR